VSRAEAVVPAGGLEARSVLASLTVFGFHRRVTPCAELPVSPTGAVFPATQWSVVVNAQAPDELRARTALEDLCRAYWPPIYAEIRRRGFPPAEAQDLTQDLFARLLRQESFGAADRSRGRFRSFLLGALDHLLADHWRKNFAEKRGSGATVLSLNDGEGEDWLTRQPAAVATPAEVFDHRWALILMDRAFQSLRAEYAASGRAQVFDAVKPFLAAETNGENHAAACAQLGLTPEAFAVAVHRLRKRFRAAVRAQVEQTVANPDEARTEMRHLFGG